MRMERCGSENELSTLYAQQASGQALQPHSLVEHGTHGGPLCHHRINHCRQCAPRWPPLELIGSTSSLNSL